jgi:hypothetical protein
MAIAGMVVVAMVIVVIIMKGSRRGAGAMPITWLSYVVVAMAF